MTVYLNAQQVLFAHDRLIARTGGSHGVRDVGLLESAVARPHATFDGVDLYRDIFSKAAALMESLILNPPFVDGNKRTAITVASLFLLRNDIQVVADNAELERFTMWIVTNRPAPADVSVWFQTNTEALL